MRVAAKIKHAGLSDGAERCRRKFLRYFPEGFQDEKYYAWERGYKWDAHLHWKELLNKRAFLGFLNQGEFTEISSRALRTLSGTNLLFSFESMALRDALKTVKGARIFAEELFRFIYESGAMESKFEAWCSAVEALPKKQSRVFTHPVVTVFGALALPDTHIFLKPMVTLTAAERYGIEFRYSPRPSWETYSSLLAFAGTIRKDLVDLKPRDMIDIQSYIWIQGSSEYP